MKKTFQLATEGRHPDRLLDAIKHEIRKYIQRERNKALPKGADYWDFDCRFGADAASAESIHVSAIRDCVNAAAAEQRGSFYLEITARAATRAPRADARADDGQSPPSGDGQPGGQDGE